MDRRSFIKSTACAAGLFCMTDWQEAWSRGKKDSEVGKTFAGWKKGQFQVHFIYTGVSESMFYIFPDGTTMLLDCGDHNAIGRGKLAVPVLPHADRHSGEWIARYVLRVNPAGKDVDYMMLSHYHSDHGGCAGFNAGVVEHDDGPYPLSGFSQAAEYLNFGKAFDRAWPTYDDPIPLASDPDGWAHIKRFYEYMSAHRGLKVEKFRVGENNQIAMLHNASKYPNFRVHNLCANGRICGEDGEIRDLYAERIARDNPKTLNENGMSLGMIFSYGPFRFYTAGDFSDGWNLPDGTHFEIEDAMAEVCGRAQVAKVNHHGHYSMPAKLLQALQSRVYVSCVWDQLHNVPPVVERISDRALYPGDRILCPGIMPKERVEEAAGAAWLKDIPEPAFEGCHTVLTVEKGGKDYSITLIGASDESMRVCSVLRFKS